MVGKRRPHKTKPPYKRIVGTASLADPASVAIPELEVSDAIENLQFETESIDSLANSESSETASRELPLEIIGLICSFCSKKFNLLFVNKSWHAMALPLVYSDPKLQPHNFSSFVTTISGDRELGSCVRTLDLTRIAQVGKNSMVSRLLRRCSLKLEVFVAPQSHFGYSPMISLASCRRLKALDLSLVSETLDLPHLFATIQNFHDLEVLYFPRSSIKCEDDAEMQWAPNLRQLGLSGGFPAQFLERVSFPASLTELQISNCPYMTTQSLNSLLDKVGPQLKKLVLTYPVPHLSATAIDYVLMQCPNLLALQVSVDYISSAAFDTDLIPLKHPLHQFSLLSSGLMGHSEKIKPGHVLLATEVLLNLKRVSVSLLLGWNPQSSIVLGLADALNDRGGGVWML